MLSGLAAVQLQDLARASAGAVELLSSADAASGRSVFTVSIDTSGIPRSDAGITVRTRERFELSVPADYPFSPPAVTVPHRRWAGTPHVQWGRQLCLYAAPSVEWNPSEGMRGLLTRLMLWLDRAAAGDLDPAGQPLHPPVAYSSYDHGWIVVRADLGARVPWAPSGGGRAAVEFAWCVRRGDRVDVLEWLTFAEALMRIEEAGATDDRGRRTFVAPAVLVCAPLDMEYPDSAAELVAALEDRGVSRTGFLQALVFAATMNRMLAAGRSDELDAAAVLVLLGAPARRLEAGGPMLAHLAAWRLDDLGADIVDLLDGLTPGTDLEARAVALADKWIDLVSVRWMVVHEARGEVTRRRDGESAAEWLYGKRVVLLGAGALGGPVSEQCARAGVRELTVVDKGAVTPGILTRQPFMDDDIGYSKAEMLAKRLGQIREDLDVKSRRQDVVRLLSSDPAPLLAADLIIDATADVGVRLALEAARAPLRDRWPATVGLMIGHAAVHGIVTVALPGATGATHDVVRRTAIRVVAEPPLGWRDVGDDFFPDPPRTDDPFLPEPGCSSPTYRGSATQVTALASLMFEAALTTLGSAYSEPMTAHAASLVGDVVARPLAWPNDLVVPEPDGDWEVRISARALSEMRAEARRGARVRPRNVETGGMLLGSFDEATRTVYVDVTTGPSPDSWLSALYLSHGTEGTQDVVASYRRMTHNRVGFVGMWHTHPYGVARPSITDINTMDQIVSPDGLGRLALMVILGGDDTTWARWLEDSGLPDVHARVVVRDAVEQSSSSRSPAVEVGIAGFPGGYGYHDRSDQPVAGA
ncbi:ThiF family adenylyltransferase [Cellulomonas sp. HZM]|uniref:ThiF family adenylyltransferase n=1 Tax=Cellulomonas sp. HZM TaxID=1454010 RepID=UPI0009DCE9FC|nr:ThiF family adenylyltransferase [Cellulomonas sp. HZM]